MNYRRRVVGAFLAFPFANSVLAQACRSTAAQTEGPFFKTDTPLRTSFIEQGSSSRFLLAGSVLSRSCQPVPHALLEFWHADEALYPGRARHIHVKVQAPGRRVLTTQLYFANDPGNARDSLYRVELVMKTPRPGEGAFDFVVEA